MKALSKNNKIICLTLIILLIFIIGFSLMSIEFNDGVSVSKVELSNVEKILATLPSAKPQIAAISEASDTDSGELLQRTVKRYTTLKDADNDNDYLYTEFNEGGYAIYDRIGEFLYERSDFGDGPYSNVFNSKDIYYGGPTYYYIKKNNILYEIYNGRKTPQTEFKQITSSIEDIRQDYLDGNINTLSLKNISTLSNSETYNLGVNIKDSALSQAAQWYFITIAMLLNYGFDNGATLQVYGDNIEAPVDTVCGKNKFGSCVLVALGLMLKYYDDLGIADMIPDDISNFQSMYDFMFATSNEYLVKYHVIKDLWTVDNGRMLPNIKLSNVDKNELRTERIHQELLSWAFPQYIGKDLNYFLNKTDSKTTFAFSISNCGDVYNKYANAHGLKNYKFTTRNGVEQVPENIVSGNPCILHLDKSTPEIQELPNPSDHAVLCFAFTGKKVLWRYDTYEVYCNFGWQDNPSRGSVCVNAKYVKYNVSANVL